MGCHTFQVLNAGATRGLKREGGGGVSVTVALTGSAVRRLAARTPSGELRFQFRNGLIAS